MLTSAVAYHLQDLHIGYDKGKKHEHSVYQHLNFSLQQGQLTTLIGANGAGKSTLIKTLTLAIPPLQGEVTLLNKRLSSYKAQEIAQHISVVLTDKISVGGLRVQELVSMGRYPYTGFWGKLGARDVEIVDQTMRKTQIYHKRNHFVADLSDGERQKVMIAKALAQETPIIILDEPTSFLDMASRMEIMNLLARLAHEQNKAILLSTHDLEQAILCSDQMWLLLEDGKYDAGTPEDLMQRGSFNGLFNPDSVVFDALTGRYTRTQKAATLLFLVNESSLPDFWFSNLCARYGYQTVRATEITPATLTISINSLHQIQLWDEGIALSIDNFHQIAQYLMKRNLK